MKQFFSAAKAIADPTRVKIIKFLLKRELCVCEIRAVLDLSQPTISNHLKTLENAGLATSRKDKNWVVYRLDENSPNPYADQFLDIVKNNLHDDAEITALCTQIMSIDRNNLCSK